MMLQAVLLIVLLASAMPGIAGISVRDDTGATVALDRPAQRVMALAPHVTELLFTAGGEQRIVGTVQYSDYPPAARHIERVGDNREVDIERLLALKPDLIVIWRHDALSRQMEQLRSLGIPLFYSDPRKLADIPASVRKLGRLMGTEAQAEEAAAHMQRRIDSLAARYRQRPRVRVFYQVWDRPLYTLNGNNIVSDMIRLCGGENIFAHLKLVAPSLSEEAVLQENPEAIVSGSRPDLNMSGLDIWKQYPSLSAVRRGNLFAIEADLVNRSGPRIIDGAAELCAKLEEARQHRNEHK